MVLVFHHHLLVLVLRQQYRREFELCDCLLLRVSEKDHFCFC